MDMKLLRANNTLTDVGSTTGGGGIKTLKTWLQHVDGAVNATNGLYVFVDAITKYEVQSTLNGAYADTAVPSAPTVTTQATALATEHHYMQLLLLKLLKQQLQEQL